MSQPDFLELLDSYIKKEFYQFEDKFDISSLQKPLQLLVLCDRYNKNEPVTVGLDFSIVRDVLQKFNTRNLLDFFGCKEYAFLYLYFFEKTGIEIAKAQKDVDRDKLLQEMRNLYDEAEKYVGVPFHLT